MYIMCCNLPWGVPIKKKSTTFNLSSLLSNFFPKLVFKNSIIDQENNGESHIKKICTIKIA
jgi:hypothetical protein